MDAATVEGYRLLLSRIGLAADDAGGNVRFTGADPVIPSTTPCVLVFPPR